MARSGRQPEYDDELALSWMVELLVDTLQAHFEDGLLSEIPQTNIIYLGLAKRLRELAKPYPGVSIALEAVLAIFPQLYGAADWLDVWDEVWDSHGEEYQKISALRAVAQVVVVTETSERTTTRIRPEDGSLISDAMNANKAVRDWKRQKMRELMRPRPESAKTETIRLSDQAETEFQKHQFKSRLRIKISGFAEARNGNVVMIEETEVVLPDSQFKLFLRLVVALHETRDGFLTRDELRFGEGPDGEEALAPTGLDQALHRLRTSIRPALKGLKATDFIQLKRSRFRLSTHRAYLVTEKEKLANHPNDVIRSLAARLPNEEQASPDTSAPA